jgi:signal transduction histidine kinase
MGEVSYWRGIMNDNGKMGFIICSNFEKEFKFILNSEKYTDVELLSFPNICDKPQREKEVILKIIDENISNYNCLCVFCSNIFSLDEILYENIILYKKDHCLELIIPKNTLEYFYSSGHYLLTSENFYNFKNNLILEGFNSITSHDYFYESTGKFLILDTEIDPIDMQKFDEFKKFVNLPCEIFPVGIDYFKLIICEIVLSWRLKKEQVLRKNAISEMNKVWADYTMVFEELLSISSLVDREKIVDKILNLFSILCAPANLIYYNINDDIISPPVIRNLRDTEHFKLPDFDPADTGKNENEKSFNLRIVYSNELLAVLVINDLMFPEFIDHYKSLSVYISSIVGLSISNSRKYILLKNSKEELAKLVATKDKFFSIIAHDLKGPIGSMSKLLDFINKKPEKMTKTDLLKILSEMGISMRSIFDLLQNLLEWSRNQRGEIKVEPEKLIINDIIDECIILLSLLLKEKNIKVDKEIEGNLIYADRKMIITVIRNLLHNAVKFSNPGSIIKIRSIKRGDLIVLSVEDSGIGIKPDILAKLFKISEHITTYGTNKEKGSGLGLILCSDFIEKNGGTISVESTEKGSKFSFTVPAG